MWRRIAILLLFGIVACREEKLTTPPAAVEAEVVEVGPPLPVWIKSEVGSREHPVGAASSYQRCTLLTSAQVAFGSERYVEWQLGRRTTNWVYDDTPTPPSAYWTKVAAQNSFYSVSPITIPGLNVPSAFNARLEAKRPGEAPVKSQYETTLQYEGRRQKYRDEALRIANEFYFLAEYDSTTSIGRGEQFRIETNLLYDADSQSFVFRPDARLERRQPNGLSGSKIEIHPTKAPTQPASFDLTSTFQEETDDWRSATKDISFAAGSDIAQSLHLRLVTVVHVVETYTESGTPQRYLRDIEVRNICTGDTLAAKSLNMTER